MLPSWHAMVTLLVCLDDRASRARSGPPEYQGRQTKQCHSFEWGFWELQARLKYSCMHGDRLVLRLLASMRMSVGSRHQSHLPDWANREASQSVAYRSATAELLRGWHGVRTAFSLCP